VVLVRLDHVASVIVNADHRVMSAAVKLCVTNCIADCVWLAIPQPTEWQRVGNQISAAVIFARADFVNVQWNMLLLALRFVSFAHHLQVRFTLPELG